MQTIMTPKAITIEELAIMVQNGFAEMNERLVTSQNSLRNELRAEIRASVDSLRTELKAEIFETRMELKAEIQEVKTELHETRLELKADIKKLDDRMRNVENVLVNHEVRIGRLEDEQE